MKILNDTLYPLFYAYALHGVLWWKRHSMLLSAVAAAQYVCTFALKELFHVERPYHYGVGHSFPSAAAATVVFFGLYYVWLIDRNKQLWSLGRYVYLQCAISTYGLLLLIARVQLLYNTVMDIVVGCVIGLVFALAFIQYHVFSETEIKWD